MARASWLMGQHPEKFLDGRMLWHGRIYSPLPFVRSLWGTRINAGPWGMAAFPSVYRTDVHPFAFLPHSIRWQVFSFILALSGLGVAATRQHKWAALLLIGAGLVVWPPHDCQERHLRHEVGRVHSLTGSRFLASPRSRLLAFHPAIGPGSRTNPRRALAARRCAAPGAAADEPVARGHPLAKRGVPCC